MKTLTLAAAGALVAAGASLLVAASPEPAEPTAALRPAGDWSTDALWHDGLVERATYDATKVIYGQPRRYEATFLTNKEAHDLATLTKADGSGETVEVWKHNQIEVVPTPNYDYKFVTTTHAEVGDLSLTRLDATSQEWCGTSFKQYLRQGGQGGSLDYFSFSYMPEAGRSEATVAAGDVPTVPFNGLPLVLRGYDFEGRGDLHVRLLPDQKSNRPTAGEPVEAVVRYAGETDAGHALELLVGGESIGTFEFADDRRHVMLTWDGADGSSYEFEGPGPRRLLDAGGVMARPLQRPTA